MGIKAAELRVWLAEVVCTVWALPSLKVWEAAKTYVLPGLPRWILEQLEPRDGGKDRAAHEVQRFRVRAAGIQDEVI